IARDDEPDGPRGRHREGAGLLGDDDQGLPALVGAAVVVLDPVEHFGLIGAAVEVLVAVLVLGLIGAAIGVVRDPVLVAVLRLGGAAVFLRVVAVDALDRRARVHRIGHAVAVGVRRRAAVLLRVVPPHAGY